MKTTSETVTLELPAELRDAIAREARRERKPLPAVLRAAIARYIEDAEDYREAAQALKRNKGKKGIPLAEVKKKLGLD